MVLKAFVDDEHESKLAQSLKGYEATFGQKKDMLLQRYRGIFVHLSGKEINSELVDFVEKTFLSKLKHHEASL